MSTRDAEAHLVKAGEFLSAARVNQREGWTNAAASNAVLSGINAKDAICLALTGQTTKSDNHSNAVEELTRAGKQGAELAPTLSRLLRLKSKAQYQRDSVADGDADKAIEWAQRLYDGARRALTS